MSEVFRLNTVPAPFLLQNLGENVLISLSLSFLIYKVWVYYGYNMKWYFLLKGIYEAYLKVPGKEASNEILCAHPFVNLHYAWGGFIVDPEWARWGIVLFDLTTVRKALAKHLGLGHGIACKGEGSVCRVSVSGKRGILQLPGLSAGSHGGGKRPSFT